MPSSTSCLAFESQQGTFLLGLILLSLYLSGELCDVFSNRALSSSSGGHQKDRQEPALFWESLFWGVPDQQLLWRYSTPGTRNSVEQQHYLGMQYLTSISFIFLIRLQDSKFSYDLCTIQFYYTSVFKPFWPLYSLSFSLAQPTNPTPLRHLPQYL